MKSQIIIVFLFLINIYPQIKKENILNVHEESKTIHSISPKNLAITSEITERGRNVYLINLDNLTEKEFIASTSEDYCEFSTNDDFVIIRNNSSNKAEMLIYNIKDKDIIEINKPDGSLVNASIINKEKILYQYRKNKFIPEIYLLNKLNNEEKFITIGVDGQWAPNGDLFYVKKVNENIRKKGKSVIDKIKKFSGILNLYNENGQELLSISNLGQITKTEWSPDSKKILIKRGKPGFSIINLEDKDNILKSSIKDYYKNQKLGDKIVYIDNPVWTQDSKYIVFLKNISDGHIIYESSIWALNLEDDTESIIDSIEGDNYIKKIVVNDKSIIYTLKNLGNRSNTISKINTNFNRGSK